MRVIDAIAAMRVPDHWFNEKEEFFPWTIKRHKVSLALCSKVGFWTYTTLQRISEASLHLEGGEVVMEDGLPELRKHLPIVLEAQGRVLVTGLGLGCVVRGLLANPAVEHIDVVELDEDIIRFVGIWFADEPRVTIHQGDALKIEWPEEQRWDYAWHDIWCPSGSALQLLHGELMHRYADMVPRQGAWAFPRVFKRIWPKPLIGGPRRKLKERAGLQS